MVTALSWPPLPLIYFMGKTSVLVESNYPTSLSMLVAKHMDDGKNTIAQLYFFFNFINVYLVLRERERQRQRQSTSRGGAEREGDTESETGSRL